MPKKLDQNMAILALILNILVLPGVGTLIAGRTTSGVLQLVLFIVGAALSFVLIGIPLLIGMWIWALIDGIDILNQARQ